ncbi:hypothetical protein P886_2191 [Alteromonadaceae bacterium 2753L.S.0a.02]|nr:hypothetical protein P886_2191 [Alteromonadaceae bacterium 2753L.S.0a.02]
MKKVVLLLILFLKAGQVSADPWSGTTRIKWLYPSADGLIFISEYANPDISSCENGSRYLIPLNHPNYNVLASALIAAFMAEKSISFNIDSDQPRSCIPTINRFHVYK